MGKKTLNRRVTIEITENQYRVITSKAKENKTTITELLRQLIFKHIDEIVYDHIPKVDLLPIDIRNFRIDGYSDGMQ